MSVVLLNSFFTDSVLAVTFIEDVDESLLTPELSILSGVTTLNPVFDVTVNDAFNVGDSIEVQRSASASFTSPETSTLVFAGADVSAARKAHGFSALSAGAHYFRARYTNGASYSPWSATESIAIAAGTAPTGITYTHKASDGLDENGLTNQRGFFYYGLDLGAVEDADRYIIISTGIRAPDPIYRISVDMHDGQGPREATLLVGSTITEQRGSALWALAAPSGGYADIEIFLTNVFSFTRISFSIGVVHKMAAPPASDTETAVTANSANPFSTGSITIPTPGLAIAVMRNNAANSITWLNGFTSQSTFSLSDNSTLAVAVCSTAGAVTPSANRGTNDYSSMAVAALSESA